MRIPVPTNTLVAFTLAGAVLTAVVAGTLAVPGVLGSGGGPEKTAAADSNVSEQLDSSAPAPNQDFTPSVQTESRYGEHDEYEDEYEEEEDEYDQEEAYEDEYEEEEDEYNKEEAYEDEYEEEEG